MREASLNSKLEDLFVSCNIDNDEATIISKEKRNDTDAAFIHRYACNDISRQAFDDVGTFINAYLKYMRENYNKEPETIPIKAKFPVKGRFNIEARVSRLHNEVTKKDYYFVHEILNDNSNIGFTKLINLTQKDSVITKTDDLENLPRVTKEIPNETTEILKIQNASKKYTRNEVATNRKKPCNSLSGVEVESDEITNEEIINILKIYEESNSCEAVDQSLTESSSSGKKTIRKTIVSSNVDIELSEPTPKEYTHNFDEFNKYADFLKIQSIIENFQVFGNQNMIQVIDDETERINPKCRVKGREKQYITATFKYNNLYVGLLELENGNKSSSGTWVIVSKSPVRTDTFNKFLDLYTADNLSIKNIKENYQFGSDPKFTTKNHERSKDLTNWTVKLLEKL